MAFERQWSAAAQSFIQDGQSNGLIQVSDVKGFYVKQKVILSSTTQQDRNLEIKRIVGRTDIYVGPTVESGNKMHVYADVSDFLLADGATIKANEQAKTLVKPMDQEYATYEQEPVNAKRVIPVDPYGNTYDSVIGSDGKNRLAVDANVSVPGISVDLDSLTPPTRPDPDNVLITGSDDGTKAGFKRAARVDNTFDLRVGISDGPNKASVNAGSELSVIDAQARSLLNNMAVLLNTISAGIPASLGQKTMNNSMPVAIASDQSPIPVAASLTDEPIKISGTENGAPNGVEFTFVNNLVRQILAAKDREQYITYADFGTKNQRVTEINYTAPSIGTGPGFTAQKKISYVLDGNRYRRTSIIWVIL